MDDLLAGDAAGAQVPGGKSDVGIGVALVGADVVSSSQRPGVPFEVQRQSRPWVGGVDTRGTGLQAEVTPGEVHKEWISREGSGVREHIRAPVAPAVPPHVAVVESDWPSGVEAATGVADDNGVAHHR